MSCPSVYTVVAYFFLVHLFKINVSLIYSFLEYGVCAWKKKKKKFLFYIVTILLPCRICGNEYTMCRYYDKRIMKTSKVEVKMKMYVTFLLVIFACTRKAYLFFVNQNNFRAVVLYRCVFFCYKQGWRDVAGRKEWRRNLLRRVNKKKNRTRVQ